MRIDIGERLALIVDGAEIGRYKTFKPIAKFLDLTKEQSSKAVDSLLLNGVWEPEPPIPAVRVELKRSGE